MPAEQAIRFTLETIENSAASLKDLSGKIESEIDLNLMRADLKIIIGLSRALLKNLTSCRDLAILVLGKIDSLSVLKGKERYAQIQSIKRQCDVLMELVGAPR